MWIAAAIGSAFFAGITAILSKCGVKSANSDVATAVRTSVVLVIAWGIALLTGACAELPAVSARSWIFLILSGLATGAAAKYGQTGADGIANTGYFMQRRARQKPRPSFRIG